MTTEELLAMCDRITNGITKTVKTNSTEYSRDPDKFCFGLQEPYELAVALRKSLADVERLTAELASVRNTTCQQPTATQCVKLWEADHQRVSLAEFGLDEEFAFGCDSIQAVAAELVGCRAELAALRQRVPQPCGVPTEPGWKWCKPAGKEWEPVTISYTNGEGFYLVCKDSECLRRLPGKVIGVTRYWVDWRLVENAEWATCPPPAGDKGG